MIDEIIASCPLPTSYRGVVYRIVETQEYAATSKIVDDLAEQHLLEQLLDDVKPGYRPETAERHYLISTPFRYPPLNYGSRFGDTTMPSYFYGAEHVPTVLAECAFYRFVFLSDMAIPHQGTIQSQHSIFSVNVTSQRCCDLTRLSNQQHIEALRSPRSYQISQAVGKYLTGHPSEYASEHSTQHSNKRAKADVIRFFSARDTQGVNLAIATPDVITSKKPEQMQLWLCQTTSNKVAFSTQGQWPVSFQLAQFCVDGKLAKPF
ncbi:RES domain-containing protein [Thalassotalea euphylliae]|uniref:RES domain-containing protein n=1 Tax=Thalassotalea euphylliae TaxID=1655234 RepID=A0A3E0TRC5_9GAMM|nr:RES family NAD+ phosphorylase [Thalassotalea euphylliae]REL27038.1 RES domain-containing protein [Thalassotalea euphylliae]